MRLWLDTEFNDYRGALISIALIDEDGREWYEVLPCHNPSEWVKVHVMTVLGKEPTSREGVRDSLREFLSYYSEIKIVCDWFEDVEHFCALLIRGPGQCVSIPPISFWVDRDLNSLEESKIPHNALEGAKAIRLQSLRQ